VSDKIDWREVRKRLLRDVERYKSISIPSAEEDCRELADAIKAAYCNGLRDAAVGANMMHTVRGAILLVADRLRGVESGLEEP
jgi:hypothetical protein